MHQTTINHLRLTIALAAATLLAALAWVAVAQPGTAHAQLPGICDQYPDRPECQDDDDDGDEGDGPDDDGGEGPTAGAGGDGPSADAGAGSGELPFTGYPLSPLLLLLLLLLTVGLAIRAYLAIRQKLSDRPVA
ncbi:MAG: hypothetical protein M3355_11005 [Actinomycetota bacterium]|nr:hypothetical protein [Actinomycetota bacterium]